MPSPERDLFGPLASALLAALVVAVGALALHERAAGPAPEPGAAEAPEALWVIPPARERAIEALLVPIYEAPVGGRRFDHFRVERDTVRVLPEGDLPEAAILLTYADGELHLRWADEGAAPPELASLERRLRAGDRGDIWVRRSLAPNPREQAREGRFGLLTPACDATGLDPYLLLALALGLGLALAALGGLFTARAPASPPAVSAPRALPQLLGLLLLGALLRLWLARSLPMESDEIFPSLGARLFDASHDAWLHPPAHRALQMGWLRLIGWQRGGSIFAFRAPSLLFGLGALGMMAYALRRERPILRELALLALALGPDLAADSVRVRPYALAFFLAAAALAAAWDRASSPRARGLRAFVVVLALGLLLYTDLLFGLALGLALAAIALLRSGAPPKARAIAVAATLMGALWAAPLAPGALEALRAPTLAQHREGHGQGSRDRERSIEEGQRPERGMGQAQPAALAAELASFTALGYAHRGLGWLALIALLAAVAVTLWRGPREAATALLLALLLAWIVGSHRSIRPRNVLFLVPLGSLLVIRLAEAAIRLRGAARSASGGPRPPNS